MTNQPTEVLQPETSKRQRARWLLGATAVLLALAAAVLQVLGIVQATALNWERGTLLAWLAIGASVLAFLVGLAAVILKRGCWLGIAAMIIAIFANPWVLTQLLGVFG